MEMITSIVYRVWPDVCCNCLQGLDRHNFIFSSVLGVFMHSSVYACLFAGSDWTLSKDKRVIHQVFQICAAELRYFTLQSFIDMGHNAYA